MTFEPVHRRSVTNDVFDQMVAGMVEGDLSAGEPLPSERRLAEVLGVSRPAVREALQRLSQAGLVEVRHGGATTVRDFLRSAGMDLLPRLLLRGGQVDGAVVRSILEARLAIGPEVVVLAARRGTPSLDGVLASSCEAIERCETSAQRQRAVLAFWDALVDGADSIVYRLMFNGLRQAYEPSIEALAEVMRGEVDAVDRYRELADAIAARDTEHARRTADRLLRPTTEAFLAVFEAIGERS